MPKILIVLTPEMEKRLRRFVHKRYSNKRGAISITMEEALKRFLEEKDA